MSSSPPRPIPTVDRISILPESVITHILSFLSTKQSAATLQLSSPRDGIHSGSQFSLLTSTNKNFADFATFRHFVYSVMLMRNNTLPIRSFRLKCGKSSSSDFNPHDVNRFIHAVVQRGGIQNLNLQMLTWDFQLPQCVLTCNSLTVLKLKRLTIPFSKEVNFPLLKTLHLEDIRPLCLSFFKIFLLGCPVLQDLHIQNVFLRNYKCGEFNGLLKLVKANIINSTTWYRNFPLDWVRYAKFLCLKLCRSHDLQVPTFLNLTNLKIVFGWSNNNTFQKWKWKWVTKVLQECPKLQNLTIQEEFSDRHEIGDGNWVEPSIVPNCLSYELRTCSLIAYKGLKCEFQFAEYILKNAKVLHTMRVSASAVDLNIKHEMLMKLSLCPRGSTTCKLSSD